MSRLHPTQAAMYRKTMGRGGAKGSKMTTTSAPQQQQGDGSLENVSIAANKQSPEQTTTTTTTRSARSVVAWRLATASATSSGSNRKILMPSTPPTSKTQMMKDRMRRQSIMELGPPSPASSVTTSTNNNKAKALPPTAAVQLLEQEHPPPPQPSRLGVVKNFRQAKGLTNIYRCAKMDDLVDRLDVDRKDLSRAEKVILFKAGLILDLRSPSEVKQERLSKWMEAAPGGKIHLLTGPGDDGLVIKESRGMLNIDVLGPKAFSLYAERKWLTSAQDQIQKTIYWAVDGDKLHEMRVEALNKRGLVGLNEVILESGKPHLCRALKAITLHLEKKGFDQFRPVIIHCAQGKDRTGMLVMLLQSIVGVNDDDIIEDYNESEATIDLTKTDKTQKRGKLDRAMMRRAPRDVMAKTLEYVRDKYGSVSPGYLQAIGFDDSWRIRLVTALLLDMGRPKQSTSSSTRKMRSSRL